jgi:hypothetical protein
MPLGKNFFTILLAYVGLLVFVELFFGTDDRIANESASHHPLANSLSLLTCLIGTQVSDSRIQLCQCYQLGGYVATGPCLHAMLYCGLPVLPNLSGHSRCH